MTIVTVAIPAKVCNIAKKALCHLDNNALVFVYNVQTDTKVTFLKNNQNFFFDAKGNEGKTAEIVNGGNESDWQIGVRMGRYTYILQGEL